MKKVIIIEGMHCMHCVEKISNELQKIENVKKVKINLKKKEAVVVLKDEVEEETLTNSIEGLGFKVVEIKN